MENETKSHMESSIYRRKGDKVCVFTLDSAKKPCNRIKNEVRYRLNDYRDYRAFFPFLDSEGGRGCV